MVGNTHSAQSSTSATQRPVPNKLDSTTRKAVVGFILRDITPVERHADEKPIDWFHKQFAFVKDRNLRTQLAQAYYQARLAQKTMVALGLSAASNALFLKMQIVLYASIFEALVDYALSHHDTDPRVVKIRNKTGFVKVDAFASHTRLVIEEDGQTRPIFPCVQKTRARHPSEISFKDRLQVAIDLGCFPQKEQKFAEAVYSSRNSMHLSKAAKDHVEPSPDEAKGAFLRMQTILAFMEKTF